MRLKSYTAPSMAEAMQMVRQELGDDAIIVSTQRAAGGKGVRITAALEPTDIEDAISEMLADANRTPAAEMVREALVEHNLPVRLVDRLINAVRTSGIEDPQQACASALEAGFAFAPLPDHGAPRPFMLVGPPGSGKSMAVAKLAARSTLKNRRVGIITADNIRAGAAAQLAAFTRILKIELLTARGPDSLAKTIQQTQGQFDIVFVDSPGLNPFKSSDLDYLSALIEAANVEPILVLAAGGDPNEASEVGEAFGGIGATRLLATRLDTTRRLGSVMAAADAAPLMFCDVSAGPHVVNGVTSINAGIMARMILPQPEKPNAHSQTPRAEASPL
ncbi:MAG TPA: GTP-binding protein [Rhodospirillaceae bacterium]|nr:GTP-binding protein [Rhodospirillaceae bacterium]